MFLKFLRLSGKLDATHLKDLSNTRCYCLRMLNSPAIMYKTTRNVIPTLENINAVNALQWSLARSKGGFCLRRTDRFRSILLPFLVQMRQCLLLSNYPLSFSPTHFYLMFNSPARNWTRYPLKYYFLCIQHTLVNIKRRTGRLAKLELASFIHFGWFWLIFFWS